MSRSSPLSLKSSAQGSVEVPPKHNYLSSRWSVGGHEIIFGLALTAQFPQARYECRSSICNFNGQSNGLSDFRKTDLHLIFVPWNTALICSDL